VTQTLIRCKVEILTLEETQISPLFNAYLVTNKCITPLMFKTDLARVALRLFETFHVLRRIQRYVVINVKTSS
jgi:hypothetical protein